LSFIQVYLGIQNSSFRFIQVITKKVFFGLEVKVIKILFNIVLLDFMITKKRSPCLKIQGDRIKKIYIPGFEFR